MPRPQLHTDEHRKERGRENPDMLTVHPFARVCRKVGKTTSHYLYILHPFGAGHVRAHLHAMGGGFRAQQHIRDIQCIKARRHKSPHQDKHGCHHHSGEIATGGFPHSMGAALLTLLGHHPDGCTEQCHVASASFALIFRRTFSHKHTYTYVYTHSRQTCKPRCMNMFVHIIRARTQHTHTLTRVFSHIHC